VLFCPTPPGRPRRKDQRRQRGRPESREVHRAFSMSRFPALFMVPMPNQCHDFRLCSWCRGLSRFPAPRLNLTQVQPRSHIDLAQKHPETDRLVGGVRGTRVGCRRKELFPRRQAVGHLASSDDPIQGLKRPKPTQESRLEQRCPAYQILGINGITCQCCPRVTPAIETAPGSGC
jgi:hypothetical protein